MEDAGISLVVAYVLGPDAADIDYLDMLMNESRFHPHRSLVVLNEGLAPQGHNPITAFKTTREHPVVRQVLARGGHVVSFPALKAMIEVTKRGLPLSDAAERLRQGPVGLAVRHAPDPALV